MVETELKRDLEDAFVVRVDEPDFQEALPRLAYAQEAENEFVRRFPRSVTAPAIYERFANCVPSLLTHAAGREAPPWEDSVAHLHRVLADASVEWLLCGSAALAIRGVTVQPRDIDFVVADHHATAAALAHLLVEPTQNSNGMWIAEWFGRGWDGTRLEWAAETRPDLDDHDWTSDVGPDAQRRAEEVEWHGLWFRVPPLDLQLAVSRERGLHDRVAAIERSLA